jgi:hypothetical protein
MKNDTNDTKKIRSWAYISPLIKEMLMQRAKDERSSESELITKAVTMYLMKDVTDESELISKMSEVIRVMENLALKIEVGTQLQIEWIQTFFMYTPDLPNDKAGLNKKYEIAAKRTEHFLATFRNRKKMMPQFLEGIFGAMLEEEKKG